MSTAEAKGIPLVHEVSRLLGLPYYIVARKSVKPYMAEPLVDEVVSITTQKAQTLCLDGKDALAVKGRRVAIVDDVISTGESLSAIERLLEKAGAEIVAKAGDPGRREKRPGAGTSSFWRNCPCSRCESGTAEKYN